MSKSDNCNNNITILMTNILLPYDTFLSICFYLLFEDSRKYVGPLKRHKQRNVLEPL